MAAPKLQMPVYCKLIGLLPELELYRLQHRYTRRKNRAEAFSSEAVYVDGEYIYGFPSRDTTRKGVTQDRVKELGTREVGATSGER